MVLDMENGVLIFDKPDEFLQFMEELQRAYNNKENKELLLW